RSHDGRQMYTGISDPTKTDSDQDRLDDRLETQGWKSGANQTFITDPMMADTDGDGLSDGDEAGDRTTDRKKRLTFALHSDPLTPDTDEDGLSDAEEADQSLDPFEPDTDQDGLPD